MKRTRTTESLRALGESVALFTPAEQVEFFNAFIAGHDRLANYIHQARPQGQEDHRPTLHDKVARALTELRDYVVKQQEE